MAQVKKKRLLKQAKSLMGNDELAEALSEMLEEQRGALGFLLSTLKKRPRTFNPYVLKGLSIYREPSALDRKTAELVAIGAATALRCEHCLDAHIARAVTEGATLKEVMDAILISGAISESSTLSVAFRKFKQQEGRLKRRGQKERASEE
ncbi:MAG TPA: carboxymuconolactone decarboxylase family protein [Thermodesulfovibrionales bacterium]|nr:carboxymuconolactone decarboxylase family protein [Thermodesulfovibrionales bacterium]